MTRDEIRADLVLVARACGRPEGIGPSEDDYREHGRFTHYRVLTAASGGHVRLTPGGYVRPRLGWSPALQVFGLRSPKYLRQYTVERNRLIHELRRVAKLAGTPGTLPPRKFYDSVPTAYHSSTVIARLESWRGAAAAAGLSNVVEKCPTQAEMIRDYQRACTLSGRRFGDVGLTAAQFDARISYSHGNAIKLFGSFAELVKRAGFRPTRVGSAGYVKRSTEAQAA